MARLLTRLADGADPDAAILLDDIEQVVDAVDGVTRPGTGLDLVQQLVRVRRSGFLALTVANPARFSAAAVHHLILGGDATTAAMAGVPRALVDPRAPAGRGCCARAA